MVVMIALLKDEGLRFSAGEEDFYNFVISVSTSEMKLGEILKWLKVNVEKR